MKKKRVLWVLLAVLGVGALFVINMFSGNPISRGNARKAYLEYFETTYGEDFTVYASTYNPKIPDYIFEMGPTRDSGVRFDTALYGMGISDEYGGMLASAKLAEDIDSILKPGYGHLDYALVTGEDPMVGYGGENPDYFETDLAKRVTKNHYLLEIILPDGSVSKTELKTLFEEMAEEIESKLPYETPNLQVNVRFESETPAWEADSKEGRGNIITLFSTTD